MCNSISSPTVTLAPAASVNFIETISTEGAEVARTTPFANNE